jgi:magnesium and cobalt transporter
MGERDELPRSRLRRFLRRFRRSDDQEEATQEVLSDLQESGKIDKNESEMIRRVLDLDQTTVREIMVPRTEIVYVDKDATLAEIVQRFVESEHSRIPVVDGDLDRVEGFVHVKDLLRYWGRDGEFDPRAVRRTLHFVPEAATLDVVLHELQAHGDQIALVIDEFGGTSGLISVEDILEEIVGEIRDEYDTEVHVEVFAKSDDSLEVVGRFAIEAFTRHFGLDDLEGDFNTVSGWITARTGRVPQAGETLHLDGFTAEIKEADARQIRRVLVKRPPPETIED